MNVKFLRCLLPDFSLLALAGYEIDIDNLQLTIRVSSTQELVKCPLCSTLSGRVHSRYERTLTDLPCVNFTITLVVQVCKFFCDNSVCTRRIFTERFPQIAAPWARKTARLVERLQTIGLALGGAAGARLADKIGSPASGSTLLNQLTKLELPQFDVPRILGVDDFSFRKGRQYGTILVDLEHHQPIALLADRKAETLADWLTQHPGVEVLSRDRSRTYRSGMNQGAPNALQVADRFHLVQNLAETLEKVLSSHSAELRAIEQQRRPPGAAPEAAIVRAMPTATIQAQAECQSKHERRIQQQQQIKHLQQQQLPQIAIAQVVGVGVRTVQRYLSLPNLPTTVPHRKSFGRGILDPYKQHLLQWWNAGIKQPSVLLNLLQQNGFQGSERTLTRYISQLRQAQGLPSKQGHSPQSSVTVIDPQSPPLTARRASYLIVQREENREPENQELLERIITQHPDLGLAVELADEFLQLLRHQQSDAFEGWLMKALKSSLKPFQSLKSSLKPFQSFAEGLLDDYAAVKASMMTSVSNGPVEGLNNRLKMLKRQMYGRAGLELLSKRFILAW